MGLKRFAGKACLLHRSRTVQCRHLRVMPPVYMGRRSSKIATRKVRLTPALCRAANVVLRDCTSKCMQISQDARKSKLYGKIGKLIVQAVKAGGTDKIGNARLHDVLSRLPYPKTSLIETYRVPQTRVKLTSKRCTAQIPSTATVESCDRSTPDRSQMSTPINPSTKHSCVLNRCATQMKGCA